MAAAIAIAPAIQSAPHRPLGLTILEAVRAARVAADTNANLGIVLLTAPLAAVSDGEPLDAAAVARVLGRLDRDDAAAVYRAIAVGRPADLAVLRPAGPFTDPLDAILRPDTRVAATLRAGRVLHGHLASG